MESINSALNGLNGLTDAELTDAVSRLAANERGATAELVAHLAVFDARGLCLSLGYPSLFAYCCEALHLSEHEAYNRIEAARAARRHPQLLGLLSEGALTLTAIRLLAPILDEGNRERLLSAAAYRSKRAVEELVAAERPAARLPDSVRRVPRPFEGGANRIASDEASAAPAAHNARLADARSVVQEPKPLAPDRFEVRFTAGAATCEKLRQARDLLRHAVPGGETAEIIDRALTVLLEQLTRKKFASVPAARRGPGVSDGARHLAAEVKRAVYRRDGGRCAFVGSGGRRCNSQAFLEFHHVRPWAEGGEGAESNVELRCRAHNQHEARLHFGPIREARAQA